MLNLHPGEDLNNVDLRLTSATPARSVSGTLRGPTGPLPDTTVHLVHAEDSDTALTLTGPQRLHAAAAVTDDAGKFTLLGVIPGRYVLRAWTGRVEGQTPVAPLPGRVGTGPNGLTLWAQIPLTVGSVDLANVAMTLTPSPSISGKLIFAGAGTPPPSSEFSVALQARSFTDMPTPAAVPVIADGSFTLRGYAPGRYVLPQTNVGGWRIASATLDGKPVQGHEIDLGTANVGSLVLSATNQFTTIRGLLQPEPGLAPIGVNILVFPADYRDWIARGMSPAEVRNARMPGTWTYTATWLPPGDYLVIVYRETDAEDLSPAFIERLAPRAERIRLAEGQPVTVALTMTQIR
jgi:hypothetical protein